MCKPAAAERCERALYLVAVAPGRSPVEAPELIGEPIPAPAGASTYVIAWLSGPHTGGVF